MTIKTAEASPREIYKMLIGMVVPRPIGWISTVSTEGVFNLAPYSFFNAVSGDPPVVCFSAARKPGGDNRKDSLRNIEETGEFVVNVVSESLVEAMNQSAADVGPEVSEFELSGLTAEMGSIVKVPMVSEALAKMECKLRQVIVLGDKPTSGNLVLGDVVAFHFAEGLVDNFRVDPEKLAAVGRMGGMSYCRTRDLFEVNRP